MICHIHSHNFHRPSPLMLICTEPTKYCHQRKHSPLKNDFSYDNLPLYPLICLRNSVETLNQMGDKPPPCLTPLITVKSYNYYY